jgi:hypothetical protein
MCDIIFVYKIINMKFSYFYLFINVFLYHTILSFHPTVVVFGTRLIASMMLLSKPSNRNRYVVSTEASCNVNNKINIIMIMFIKIDCKYGWYTMFTKSGTISTKVLESQVNLCNKMYRECSVFTDKVSSLKISLFSALLQCYKTHSFIY